MLKRIYRLGKIVKLTKGKIYNGQFFTLRIAKNGLFHNRFAFVVSKKIDKRAVVRNKIKRKLRFCIEKMFNKIKTGYDFVFYVKKLAASQALKDLCLDVKTVLEKEELLK